MTDLVFMAELGAGDKKPCPCCGRHAQVYRRSIHSTIAAMLVIMLKLGVRSNNNYIHSDAILDELRAQFPSVRYNGRDFCILKYWKSHRDKAAGKR